MALRTYRAVHPHDGQVQRHEGFWAVTTPNNPSFFWGNFLQFDAPPAAGDAERWPALFNQVMAASHPGTGHVALCWDNDAPGHVAPFLERGYGHDENVVMVANQVVAARKPSIETTLRRVHTSDDWEALVRFHVRTRAPQFSEAGYTAYVRPRVAQWRMQAERGCGTWVAAFVGDELAAALGLYAEVEPGPDGLRLARYQEVTTDERWRRRGLCSALLAHAAELLGAKGIDRYVIITDANDIARPVYAARGFDVAARAHSLLLARRP